MRQGINYNSKEGKSFLPEATIKGPIYKTEKPVFWLELPRPILYVCSGLEKGNTRGLIQRSINL